ncbi:MAG: hypothetical protein GY757_29020 [bacterium]|nr:hypothetical protein [bacterium]
MKKFEGTSRKLFLNKESITNLNDFEMIHVNAGLADVTNGCEPDMDPGPTHHEPGCDEDMTCIQKTV